MPLCPYCARELGSGLEATRDHIFVRALGGHQTVPACKQCNSQIGSQIEGLLLRSGAILNLVRFGRGRGPRMIEGELSDGTRVRFYSDGRLEHRNPVQHDSHSGTISLGGSVEQVKAQLRRLGASVDQVENLVSSAQQVDLPGDVEISSTVSYDVTTICRLTAKVALGAGAYVDQDLFITSGLANILRDVLWGRKPCEFVDSEGVLQALRDFIQRSSPPGLSFDFGPNGFTSQVMVLSSGTRIFVVLYLSGALMPIGLAVTSDLPFSKQVPLIVEDELPNANIIWVLEELARAVVQRYQQGDELPD